MDVDLAIVGGGPAGVATALFLVARAPSLRDRIVVLEKERYPREKICAGAIGARADRALARIGVRVEVPSIDVRAMSVVANDGELRASLDEPIGRVVRRVEFDRAFADKARERGIRIVEGAAVRNIERGERSVRIDSTAGELRARALVGADGVGSFVRRSLGAPRGRFNAQVVEVDTPLLPSETALDTLHFDLTDRTLSGYAWDFPTLVGGKTLACRGVFELRDDEDTAERGDDVGARLSKRLARLGVEPVGKTKRFAERGLALNEPMAFRRALLVGEAAGIDPVLGEGIAQAILYGKVAGPYLAERLLRDELDFADWPKAFRLSRIGFDLLVRHHAVYAAYGPQRPTFEHWLTHSENLAIAGMHYFAGKRIQPVRVARAVWDLARSAVGRVGRSRAVAGRHATR